MSTSDLLVAKHDHPPSDLEFGDFLMIPAPDLPDLFRLSPLRDNSDGDVIVQRRTSEEGEVEGDSEDHPTCTDASSHQNPSHLGEYDDAPIINNVNDGDVDTEDGFRTPTLTESRIPQPEQCPPPPRKLPVAPRKIRPATPRARRRLDFDPWEELEVFMASPLPFCTDIGGGGVGGDNDIHDRHKIKKARTDGHSIE